MASFACLCFSVTAFAQTWPQRALKVIAPYPPGGPSDIVIRTVSDKVQAALKQAVIIENIPGAGGNIGSAAAARAPADGYTWLITTDTVMTVNPHVYKNMGFKLDDLKPVSILIATCALWQVDCFGGVGANTVTNPARHANHFRGRCQGL